MPSSQTYDVVVAGAGAAGMMAALTAARSGLSVLVIEKADRFGGSAARSGGSLWIPGSDALSQAGGPDDPRQAARYLAHLIGPDGDPRLADAFLEHGPQMVRSLLDWTPLSLRPIHGLSDSYPDAPGGRLQGRALEPASMPVSVLGGSQDLLADPYVRARGGLVITQQDYRWLNLALRHPRGVLAVLRIGTRRMTTGAGKRREVSLGQALAAGLWAGMAQAGVTVRLSCALRDLRTHQGRVTGVQVSQQGRVQTVLARHGVVLATGGFDHNATLRALHQPGRTGHWTLGASGNTGDGLQAGQRAGADVTGLDDAWWAPSVLLPHGPFVVMAERTLPGCIMVGSDGRRFVNEAGPPSDVARAMFGPAQDTPAWLIFDQRFRERYPFLTFAPREPFPGQWYREGLIHRSRSLTGLATRCGLPADALRATIDRFNGFAAIGMDHDFRRGESSYDAYFGDPRNHPGPCLGELVKAPFHAVRVVPGDLGTKGGLVSDDRARVLRADGTAIQGLFAAGNTSALLLGQAQAGPGSTIGPAMTFGYLAALEIARAARAIPAGQGGATVSRQR